MSTTGIESILTRAMSDPVFAEQLLADAEKALTDYDLTPEEMAALKSMSRANIEKLSTATPEERRSFWIIIQPWKDKTGGTSL